MAGRKRDVSRTENQAELTADNALLSEAQEREILDEVLVPKLRELLAAELEVALDPNHRDGSMVRGRLIDRIIGKTSERKANTSQPKIVVNLLQVGNEHTPKVTTEIITGGLVEPSPKELMAATEQDRTEVPKRFGYDKADF